MDVSIIGSGFAGLACAYALRLEGIDATIYEAGNTTGGAVASYDLGNYKIEKFYHHMSQHDFTAISTIKKMGLGSKLVWRLAKNGYFVNGKLYNLNNPLEILTYPHLSLGDKIRLAKLTKLSMKLEIKDYDSVPLKEWLMKHISEKCYENFFLPGLRSKLGENMDKASAAWMISRIQYRSHRGFRGEKLGYLRGGFHQLVESLVKAVGEENIITGAAVQGMNTSGGRIKSIKINGKNVATDRCVVTVNPYHVRELLPEFSSIGFQGSVCAVVATKARVTNSYWTNVADAGSPFGVIVEHTNFMPIEDYGGDHLLYLGIYVQNEKSRLWTMKEESLVSSYFLTLKSMFPAFDRSQVRWIKVGKIMGASPIYDMGYLKKMIPYELRVKGLYYAGMCSPSNYPERSISGSLEAGFSVAGRIISGGRA